MDKLVCKICGKQLKNYYSLRGHLIVHKITSKKYYNLFLRKENEDICRNLNCKNKTVFVSIRDGYRNYCSLKCSNSDTKVKLKKEETCQKNFGVKCSLQSQEIKEKNKNIFLEKYGVENSSQVEEFKEKKKKTCFENFGVENFAQTEEWINHMKNGQAVDMISKMKNPSVPQVKLYNIAKELYEDAILNYPLQVSKRKWYCLDTAVLSIMLDIEYDETYWHQDIEKDKKRDEKIKSKGWKVLRYRDRIPTLEQLRNDIGEVIKNGQINTRSL